MVRKGGSMDVNISLSYELVCLINWLLKNEKPALNALVKQAIKNGFLDDLEQVENPEQAVSQEFLYTTVFEFLLHLEKNLIKHLETIQTNTQEELLFPALQRMDATNLDARTMWLSMHQAKNVLNKTVLPATRDTSADEAATVLFERIIKNWKPNQNEPLN